MKNINTHQEYYVLFDDDGNAVEISWVKKIIDDCKNKYDWGRIRKVKIKLK